MTQSAYQPVWKPSPVRLKTSSGFRLLKDRNFESRMGKLGKLRQNKVYWVMGQTLEADSFSLDPDSSS